MRPRLLDLFAGAGGAGVGYEDAGFLVTAVDIEQHPDNPQPFRCADALDVLRDRAFLDRFDVVHASPPCQAYSAVTPPAARAAYVRMIGEVRDRLRAWGGPYVIENVERARDDMHNPVMLCGSSFGLGAVCRDGVYRQLRRHRLFESNVWLWAQECRHSGEPLGVYGTGGGGHQTRGYRAFPREGREAMGIDWMRQEDLVQAIPPAYTEYLGRQLLDHLASSVA